MVGKISVLDDYATFIVSVIPKQTLERPSNITNTGQITLKAPTGSFKISTIKSLTGVWQLNTIIEQPLEAPDFDYIIFSLVTPISNPSYQAEIDTPLFSFKNEKGCFGNITLIENFSDPFWPPNSLEANIGNQLTILAYGIENAYEKNHPISSIANCPSTLEVVLLVDQAKCADENATLKIVFQDGVPPFNFQLSTEEQLIQSNLINKGDTTFINLLPGNYDFLGFDQIDSFQQFLPIHTPSPLQIEVSYQEEITCHNNGATIALIGQGGLSPSSFQYAWSNGSIGRVSTNLSAGNYFVTLSDENNCRATKEIIVEPIKPIYIDSIEIYPPTCYDLDDGLIELVKVENGTPPFQYAINKERYQNENYFTNLVAGTYDVNVSDDNNCVTTRRITLNNPNKLAILSLQMDSVLLPGQSTQILPILSESINLHYNWSPATFLSCSDCPNPIATPRSTINYTLRVSDEFGCETSYSTQIRMLQKRPIYAPNAFTPNNDGKNDLFEIFTGPTISFGQQLQIFNRWGQLVHHMENNSNNKNLQWDGFIQGKLADSGIYIYVAKLQLENGGTEIKKGDFFLLK